MKRILLATALVLSCSIATATAGTATGQSWLPNKSDSDCAKARKAGRACQLVFDGDTVDGDRVSGDGDLVSVADTARFGNLIEIRSSFRDLIVKSADDL